MVRTWIQGGGVRLEYTSTQVWRVAPPPLQCPSTQVWVAANPGHPNPDLPPPGPWGLPSSEGMGLHTAPPKGGLTRLTDESQCSSSGTLPLSISSSPPLPPPLLPEINYRSPPPCSSAGPRGTSQATPSSSACWPDLGAAAPSGQAIPRCLQLGGRPAHGGGGVVCNPKPIGLGPRLSWGAACSTSGWAAAALGNFRVLN